MHIIPATDLDIVRQLLKSSALPSEDVGSNPRARFYLLQDHDRTLALAGLEPYGREALLRSLAVVPEYRGQGLAVRLVEHVQQQALAGGAATLYLLTTSAADYFRRLGFHDLPRAQAPATIRQSREFAQLCPDHAALLCQRLSRR